MEQQLNTGQSESKPKTKKIITVVIFLIIILAVIYVLGTEGARWWKERQKWIKMGFASDKFPFRMYTERELVERGLWSGESEYYNSIPTRTTPEETYAIFKQALIDEDIDKAVECFVEDKRQEYKEALEQAKKEGRISEIIKQLTEIYPEDEKINKGLNNNNTAIYYVIIVENGKKTNNPIPFSKDLNGDWKLEDL